jgi:hypothetical protein
VSGARGPVAAPFQCTSWQIVLWCSPAPHFPSCHPGPYPSSSLPPVCPTCVLLCSTGCRYYFYGQSRQGGVCLVELIVSTADASAKVTFKSELAAPQSAQFQDLFLNCLTGFMR